jgi:hypothetical protein
VNVFVPRGDVDAVLGEFAARPDLVAGVPLYLHDPTLPGSRRINAVAFSVPAEVRQGTLGRNALRGFPLTQLDFAIHREFGISEKVKLQWRTEFFNLFNHPNFGIVDATLGFLGPPFQPNPTFRIAVRSLAQSGDANPIYKAGGARSIQLSLRLSF